jgi:hypothetical protein
MKANSHSASRGADKQITTAPLSVPAITTHAPEPEWLRLPKSGTRCPFSGMARSGLNELVLPCAANGNCPPVRSIVLRKPGRRHGVCLISAHSLREYLDGLAAEQCGNGDGRSENNE